MSVTTTRRFSFFMRDGTIREIEAVDAETALAELGKQVGKCSHLQRHWLLREIKTCLTPSENYALDK